MSRWPRDLVVLLCALVVAVSVPTAPLASWLRGAVEDTDGYVAAVAPLARDPQVQDALAVEVSARVLESFDAEAAVRDWLAETLGPAASLTDGLVTRTAQALRGGVEAGVRAFVGTDAFASAWDAAQRGAHNALSWALTSAEVDDGHRPVVGIDASGAVVLDLGTVATSLVSWLEGRDLPVPTALRDLDVRVTLLTSSEVAQARSLYGTVGTWSALAPWAALGAAVVALVVARRRDLATCWLGLAALVGIGVTVLGARILAERMVDGLELPQDGVLALVTDRVTDRLATGLPELMVTGAAVGGLVLAAGLAAVVVRVVRTPAAVNRAASPAA